MTSVSISKAFYLRKNNELWLLFSDDVCKVYVDLKGETLTQFAKADDRDSYYQQFIYKKFKFYFANWELCYPFREAEKSIREQRKMDAEYNKIKTNFLKTVPADD